MFKKILKYVVIALAVVLVLGAGFVGFQVIQFDRSMDHVHAQPPLAIQASRDPAVLARGEHLAKSIAGCSIGDCHGSDLTGGRVVPLGPMGVLTGPNVTVMAPAYTDGELARLLRHGIKKDGRSVRFMPAHEISWLPDSDLTALVSYVRTLPVSPKGNGPLEMGVMAKVLDRLDLFHLDVARRIDHASLPEKGVPAPEPTAKYGQYIGRLCVGCHGATYSGGPIPGAPPEIPVPTNITPHETGLKGWTFADFERVLDQGIRKDGGKLHPFMPIDGLKHMDATERQALWAFLQSLPPREFGNR